MIIFIPYLYWHTSLVYLLFYRTYNYTNRSFNEFVYYIHSILNNKLNFGSIFLLNTVVKPTYYDALVECI